MNNICKKTLTAVLAFALASEGSCCGASFSEVSAAEQPLSSSYLTDDPAEFIVDAGVYEAGAGDVVKIKIKTKDVRESFNSLIAYFKVNTEVFELISAESGDIDDPENDTSRAYIYTNINCYESAVNSETISVLYTATDRVDEAEAEGMVLSTIKLKVKNDAKDGCYELPFGLSVPGEAMASDIIKENGKLDVKVLDPEFHGALITVGKGSEETIPLVEIEEPEDPEKPEETEEQIKIPEYSFTETGQPFTSTCPAGGLAAFTVDAGVYEVKAGDTVKIKIKAAAIKESFCGLAAYLTVNTDIFSIISMNPGDSDDISSVSKEDPNTTVNTFMLNEKTEMILVLYSDISGAAWENDRVLATVELKVKDDADDGSYGLPFALTEGATASQIVEKDGNLTVKNLYPDFLGALIKVGITSSETKPQEQDEESMSSTSAEIQRTSSSNSEITSQTEVSVKKTNNESASQTEVSVKKTNNEELQNKEAAQKLSGNVSTGTHHGHFHHRNRREKIVVKKIVNDISDVFSYMTRAIFSFF